MDDLVVQGLTKNINMDTTKNIKTQLIELVTQDWTKNNLFNPISKTLFECCLADTLNNLLNFKIFVEVVDGEVEIYYFDEFNNKQLIRLTINHENQLL